MVWVKVCGLSEMSDLEAAVEAGADAFGLGSGGGHAALRHG